MQSQDKPTAMLLQMIETHQSKIAMQAVQKPRRYAGSFCVYNVLAVNNVTPKGATMHLWE